MKKKIKDLDVLLVEQRSFQRAVGLRLLESLGVEELRAAASGPEALVLIAERAPDVVVCDLQMKDTDGIAVVRDIAQQAPDVSVILSSTLEGGMLVAVEKMVQAYGARVAGIIGKPLEPAPLREALERACRSERRQAMAPIQPLPDAVIRSALDEGRFVAHYEPKVEVATGKVSSVEALARLYLDGQLVSPIRFVPRIEELGWMEDLTFNILKVALRDLIEWDQQHVKLKVAINVPPSLLNDPGFPDRFHGEVRARGVAPERLTLEITETASVSGQGGMLESLARLRIQGFELAIDDFGTGHSSLQQLAQAPFSEMKIDREFVSGAPSRYEMRMVVESSVELARRLKLKVCAEGVDNVEAMSLLWDLRVDSLQGWLFSKPLPAERLLWWIDEFEREDRLKKLYLSS